MTNSPLPSSNWFDIEARLFKFLLKELRLRQQQEHGRRIEERQKVNGHPDR